MALPVTVFLLSIAIPGNVGLGGLSLSPCRIVLLVMLLPCLSAWLSGRAGPIRSPDIAVLLFCAWYGVSFAAAEGLSAAIQPAGINMIEVAGAYFLARCYIRSHEEFHAMIRLIFMIMLVLLPIAAVEAFTGRNMIAEIFGIVLDADDAVRGEGVRWGLRRANTVFDHPIMFGVAAAVLLPLTHYVLGENSSTVRRWMQCLAIVGLAGLSLSSAPIGLMAILIVLMTWDALLRSFYWRWHVVVLAAAIGYFGVEILSNQTPVEFYIHHFTFNGQTRLVSQVDLGLRDGFRRGQPALRHRLCGVGPTRLDDTEHRQLLAGPFHSHRHARRAISCWQYSVSPALAVARSDAPDNSVRRCRTAYLMALFGLFFTGATVHFWGSALALFLFVVGSGLWITTTETSEGNGAGETRSRTGPSRGPARVEGGPRSRRPATVGHRVTWKFGHHGLQSGLLGKGASSAVLSSEL